MQVGQQVDDEVHLAAQPQAHVGGDLVVSGAAGVQALAGVAHQLGQARFDVEVNVFEVQLPLQGPGLDLGRDLRHAALDIGMVGRAETGEFAGARGASSMGPSPFERNRLFVE